MGSRYGRRIFIGARDLCFATSMCFAVFLVMTAAIMGMSVALRLPPPMDQVFAAFATATLLSLVAAFLSGALAMLLRRFKP